MPNDEIYDRVKDALGLSESKKATLGKRSDADSHNSLSEGLPLAGSERLSGMALTPPEDFIKIRNGTEMAKATATKLIKEGRFKRGRIRQVYWLFISRGV